MGVEDNSGRFRLYDESAAAERVTILPNGNVGIGTTNPAANIHLSGTGNRFIDISSTDALASQTRLMAVTSNGVTESQIQYRNMLRLVEGIGGTTRLQINPGGNVGIGTTSPAEKLDVNGNLLVRGNFVNFQVTGPYRREIHNTSTTQEVNMTCSSRSFCFLTMQRLEDIDTGAEWASCRVEPSPVLVPCGPAIMAPSWKLVVATGSGCDDCDVICEAHCFSW